MEMKDSRFLTFAICFIVISFNLASGIPLNSSNKCPLKMDDSSSSRNDTNCSFGNWGGFINPCCGPSFMEYLQALAWRTNQTGQVFLDSAEQYDCLSSMKSNRVNVTSCGIEKLTKGVGGCSNYTATDVVSKLGNRLRSLKENCQQLGSANATDQERSRCLHTWQEIYTPSNNSNDPKNVEPDTCSFALLIVLTSQRIHDDKWFGALYKCLGDNNIHQDTIFQANRGVNNTISPEPFQNNQETKGGHHTRLHGGHYAMIAGLAAMGVTIIAICFAFWRKKSKKVHVPEEVIHNSFYDDSTCMTISIREVYSATDDLSPINIIGQGIAGKVYKGVLSNGQHVAVKHIINDGQMETFVREVKSLSHIKHPNLVSLLFHCDGEDECFLVYELCHNGNLSQWLFGKDKNLSWIRRLEIALDCARGLWFLHTYPEGRIVHRDIKPTNILVCDNFQGKLSDFGLSKVMNMGQSFVSSEVRGTFGYVDPEYQKNRHVNASGDVYSFGIVLLQILSGQRVINMEMQRPMHVNKMATSLVKGGKINDFADPKLNGEYSVAAFNLVLKVALSCTGLKQQRPTMKQVVATLEKALDVSENIKPIRPSYDSRY